MRIYEQHKNDAQIVLMDRFELTSLVYFLARCEIQNIKIDLNKVREIFLEPFGMGILNNTLTVYLDCPADIAAMRIFNRNGRRNFDIELQQRARNIYLRELEVYKNQKALINAAGTIEDTFARVNSVLKQTLRGLNDRL